ncbi:MAG TPA: 16S rRNA (adenine(1518)-N(6)/adenine(1519)-N(6))-dimethyltransferase RsmA [Pseudomonadales bacterium]|nr:16S rRNA (adenine(1518)-N(6)/adenine(1519)-N(6))-dimethyltransferase RsmA [Pseudomonadales bacterium]
MSKSVSGHTARKRFGQNFLHDPYVIDKIINAIYPRPGQAIVEIGPGLGALTAHLLEEAEALDVVELDRDLIPRLNETLGHLGSLTIHAADALKFDFAALARQRGKKLRIVGNLPYNISTPLLFHLLENTDVIEDMHFMLQHEVVERMAAVAGEDAYGRLSIAVQYHCQVEYLFKVGPGAFQPAPKVDSAVVRLVPHQTKPFEVQQPDLLEKIVTSAFNQRRKTLRNALKHWMSAEELDALGIDAGLRPEVISLEQYCRITHYVSQRQPG